MTTCGLRPDATAFYVAALTALTDARVPFLVGGSYALERYTGIGRDTKDLDVFVRPGQWEAALDALAAAGFRTERTFSHWLGKAFRGGDVIDVIFNSGNGFAPVDDEWFSHAVDDRVLGVPARLCPVEETIWSKAFVMERERYDGADVAHLLLAAAERLDWARLLRRFGPHWRLLLGHLVLFGFIYPGDRWRIPPWVMAELSGRLQRDLAEAKPGEPVCCGTLLSRAQFLVDIERWGYRDARRLPPGTMTEGEIAAWTAAIESDQQGDAARGDR